MTLDEIRDLAVIAASFVGALTLFKTFLEYSRQGAQKRAEHFFALDRRLSENQEYLRVLDLVEFDKPGVSEIPFSVKRELLGLFEEVEVMVASGLIREEVALHFFGYYAIDCWNNKDFWHDIDRDGVYWIVLRRFVQRMERVRARAGTGKCAYRM